MRKSKHVGFAAICLGFLFIVGAAALPVGPANQRLGPFNVDVRGDNCGPAGYVAFDDGANAECRGAAHRRLLVTTGLGLLVVALGMAMFAGGDEAGGSRIEVVHTGIPNHPGR